MVETIGQMKCEDKGLAGIYVYWRDRLVYVCTNRPHAYRNWYGWITKNMRFGLSVYGRLWDGYYLICNPFLRLCVNKFMKKYARDIVPNV